MDALPLKLHGEADIAIAGLATGELEAGTSPGDRLPREPWEA